MSAWSVVKIIIGLVSAVTGSGITYQFIATKLDESKYPALGKKVNLGGYSLHMIDSGESKPVVIMESGIGGTCLDWSLVQPEIAKFTRVITYDRAGHGWSDSSPLARTSENMVYELNSMLKKENIHGPYILVGASFGGLNVRLFADKYPEEVAGVVLVDASHENSQSTFEKGRFKYFIDKYEAYKNNIERIVGYYRLSQMTKEQQVKFVARVQKYPQNIQEAYWSLRLTTRHGVASFEELLNLENSFNQLKISRGFLHDKPLVVITAGKKIQNNGRYTQEQLENKQRKVDDLQKDLVKKSSRGKQVIAQNSGHHIAYDQPEIIVEVVREMVDGLRNKNCY